ncbi:hypothetical protein M422DRAFT_50433 [Sphaerobolus stellatus SS14]|uniref:DUF6534 domain-containing protein n=1 Tax=Sphaerobolus stellatus (strain SS14) TaxID=990650 RepID=A0A0C9URE6_SPHS4|nr:hypothetical protein M422DRAFT_50433 [Sphaerobolus stellatus SS14]
MDSSVPQLNSTYGAIFVGVLFAAFFQGVLGFQAFVYYENFSNDPILLKTLVRDSIYSYSTWLPQFGTHIESLFYSQKILSKYGQRSADLIHLVFVARAAYVYTVTLWGDINSFKIAVWEYAVQLIPLGVAVFISQIFFLWRIYKLSNRNKILTGFLSALCLIPFALCIALAVQNVTLEPFTVSAVKGETASKFRARFPEVTNLFAIGAVSQSDFLGIKCKSNITLPPFLGDAIITLLLCFYLHRGRGDFERTNSLISRAVRYSVTTGLVTR